MTALQKVSEVREEELGLTPAEVYRLPHGFSRDDALLLAAAPKTLTRDVNLLLSTLAEKAKDGHLSPKGFVGALRYLRDFANKPGETFSGLVASLRKAQPFGPLLLQDPDSPAARAMATAAALIALQRFENGALASQSVLDAGMRILSFADDRGLLAPGVSREKIRAVLQPPMRAALEQFVKRYGSDPSINKILEAGGQRGNLKANPPRTPLQTLLADYR